MSLYESLRNNLKEAKKPLKSIKETEGDATGINLHDNINRAISDINAAGRDITYSFISFDDDFNYLKLRAYAVGPDGEDYERDVQIKLCDGISYDAIYEAIDTWDSEHRSPDNFYEAEDQKDNDRLYNDFMQLVGKYSNAELDKLAKDLQEYVTNDEGVNVVSNRVSTDLINSYIEDINNCKSLDELKRTVRKIFKDDRVDDTDYDWLMDNTILEKFEDLGFTFPEDESTYEVITHEVDDYFNKLQEAENTSNKYAYLAHVLNFLNNTAPGGISDGEIRVLADNMYNIDTGKGELPREESTFVVTPEQREEVTAAIETDNFQRFLSVIGNIVAENSEDVVKEAAGPEIPAYLGDPNDDPDWHPESKRNEKPEPEVVNFKDKNRPEPTGEIVTSKDLNYPGVAFKAIDGDLTLYVTAWWSDNEPFNDEEEKLEWEDPDDVWDINYNIYDEEGNEMDGGLLITYDYDKWSASELCNDLLGLSGYIVDFKVSLISTDEVEDLLEESQTQEIGNIVSDMVKNNPKAEKYLDEYLHHINTLEPKNEGYNNDTDKFNDDWEDWYRNTANVIYNPTAWNKFIEWVKEKYGEDAIKGLNESEDLKSFKFKVYTESSITNGRATRLANTVNTLKEAEDLVQSYRKGKLKAHYTVNKD